MSDTDDDIAAGRKHWSDGDCGEIHLGQRSYCGICSGQAISNATFRAMAPLRAQLAEAKAVLREVEWLGEIEGYDCCPSCQGYDPRYEIKECGHAPDCRLAKAIGT